MLRAVVKNALPYGLVAAIQRNALKETHINRALARRRTGCYVEIGVREGECFDQIRGDHKIGIDPNPLPSDRKLGPGESFCQMTSDEFFKEHAATAISGLSVDVALVDGLHEFTQALRDVLNLERFMSPKGVIFIHDCNPATENHAADEYKFTGPVWNGDVWKVVYYLRNHRPDLHCFTLDCDFGVGVVSGFSGSGQLNAPSDDVLREIKHLDYGVLAKQRGKVLGLRSAWCSR